MAPFLDLKKSKNNVLVATSGDTGSAVANGFLGVEGIHVYVLYPKGKVSEIQEKQFTTLGQNITALEIDGTFDDCQALVKSAFMDKELNEHLQLTSANSINVARFLPQAFYYFYAYAQLKKYEKFFFFFFFFYAQVKIFLLQVPKARAERRYKELVEKGSGCKIQQQV